MKRVVSAKCITKTPGAVEEIKKILNSSGPELITFLCTPTQEFQEEVNRINKSIEESQRKIEFITLRDTQGLLDFELPKDVAQEDDDKLSKLKYKSIDDMQLDDISGVLFFEGVIPALFMQYYKASLNCVFNAVPIVSVKNKDELLEFTLKDLIEEKASDECIRSKWMEICKKYYHGYDTKRFCGHCNIAIKSQWYGYDVDENNEDIFEGMPCIGLNDYTTMNGMPLYKKLVSFAIGTVLRAILKYRAFLSDHTNGIEEIYDNIRREIQEEKENDSIYADISALLEKRHEILEISPVYFRPLPLDLDVRQTFNCMRDPSITGARGGISYQSSSCMVILTSAYAYLMHKVNAISNRNEQAIMLNSVYKYLVHKEAMYRGYTVLSTEIHSKAVLNLLSKSSAEKPLNMTNTIEMANCLFKAYKDYLIAVVNAWENAENGVVESELANDENMNCKTY